MDFDNECFTDLKWSSKNVRLDKTTYKAKVYFKNVS